MMNDRSSKQRFLDYITPTHLEGNIVSILIVEDDVGIFELLKERLEVDGYETAVARSGGEALAYLETHAPDLMVLDYVLPDMNGQELMVELKKREQALPAFIVSSGQGDERIAVEMMKLGARDYVVKDAHFLEILPQVIKRVEREIQNEHKLKQTEKALRESEERFRSVFEDSAVGMMLADQNGRYLKVNRALSQVFGYSQQELLAMKISDLTFPGDVDQKSDLARQLWSGESDGFAMEKRYVHRDGHVVWGAITVSPLRDAGGKTLCTLGQIQDITERKRAEGEIKQRAAHLSLINDVGQQITVLELDLLLNRAASLVHKMFDYHHVALFLVEGELLRLKAVAGQYKAYFPQNHAQLLSKGINGWVATHGQKVIANDITVDQRYTSLIAEHSVTQAELCLPIKIAGQTVGVLDIQSPRLNAFGENDIIAMETLVNQIAATIQNAQLYEAIQQELIEHKQAEKALQKSKEHLQLAINAARIAIWDWNIKKNYTIWSNNAEEVLGFRPGSFGNNYEAYMKWVHPEDVEAINDLVSHTLEEKQVEYQSEHRVIRPNGEIRWINALGQVFYDSSGSPLRIAGIMIDITERTRAKEQIKTSLREKEMLLREVHHRVKNNLQIVSGLLDMSSQRATQPEVTNLLAESRARVQTMALIHSQLYQSERFDSIDLKHHLRQLLGFIEQAYASQSRAISTSIEAAEITLSLTQAIPCALALNEVLTNAYRHAFEEGQKGTIRISIQHRVDTDRGVDTIVISVKDNGVGLPEEVDIDTADSLGLKLVRGLIQGQLRGQVQIERNQGTQVTMEFKIK